MSWPEAESPWRTSEWIGHQHETDWSASPSVLYRVVRAAAELVLCCVALSSSWIIVYIPLDCFVWPAIAGRFTITQQLVVYVPWMTKRSWWRNTVVVGSDWLVGPLLIISVARAVCSDCSDLHRTGLYELQSAFPLFRSRRSSHKMRCLHASFSFGQLKSITNESVDTLWRIALTFANF